jgi:hypothetical protein
MIIGAIVTSVSQEIAVSGLNKLFNATCFLGMRVKTNQENEIFGSTRFQDFVVLNFDIFVFCLLSSKLV